MKEKKKLLFDDIKISTDIILPKVGSDQLSATSPSQSCINLRLKHSQDIFDNLNSPAIVPSASLQNMQNVTTSQNNTNNPNNKILMNNKLSKNISSKPAQYGIIPGYNFSCGVKNLKDEPVKKSGLESVLTENSEIDFFETMSDVDPLHTTQIPNLMLHENNRNDLKIIQEIDTSGLMTLATLNHINDMKINENEMKLNMNIEESDGNDSIYHKNINDIGAGKNTNNKLDLKKDSNDNKKKSENKEDNKDNDKEANNKKVKLDKKSKSCIIAITVVVVAVVLAAVITTVILLMKKVVESSLVIYAIYLTSLSEYTIYKFGTWTDKDLYFISPTYDSLTVKEKNNCAIMYKLLEDEEWSTGFPKIVKSQNKYISSEYEFCFKIECKDVENSKNNSTVKKIVKLDYIGPDVILSSNEVEVGSSISVLLRGFIGSGIKQILIKRTAIANEESAEEGYIDITSDQATKWFSEKNIEYVGQTYYSLSKFVKSGIYSFKIISGLGLEKEVGTVTVKITN